MVELTTSKFVTLPDGVRIHYVENGPADAPTVIMSHGFLGALRDWRANITPLAELGAQENYPLRTIAFDWVGFGDSSKPERKYSLFYFAETLRDFAEALGLHEFYLLGHSMGGKHSLAFTILYPTYVKKLVLVDTDGFLDDPWWTNQTEKPWFKPFANLSTELLGQKRFLKTFLSSVIYDRAFFPDEAVIEAEVAKLRTPEYKAFLRMLNRDYPGLSLNLTGLRQRLDEIKVPVQIIWGLQDKILNIKQGQLAHQLLPQSEFYIFDGCGHLPQLEKAAEFNRLVLNFLRQ